MPELTEPNKTEAASVDTRPADTLEVTPDATPAAYVPLYESKLRQVADEVKNGKSPVASPREILRWFSAERRGIHVVAGIRSELKKYDLITFPDFEYEFIDGLVTFSLKPVAPTPTTTPDSQAPTETPAPATAPTTEQPPTPTTATLTSDPTYRIGKLAAANQPLVSVAPDAEINKAVTLMMQHDYSQLPVMVGDRNVKGLFSWQSLATCTHFGNTASKVSDCMTTCQVISSEMSIFDAVSEIVRHQVVLVRNPTNLITGIVTTTDLSQQFRQLGEPFLLLGEVENHIRQLLDNCYTKTELEAVRDSADSDREVNSVADLTFGEYLRLVENEDRWKKLSLPLDRKVFIERLDAIRLIRNDVMHFDPDGIAGEDLHKLREFSAFLQKLSALKAT